MPFNTNQDENLQKSNSDIKNYASLTRTVSISPQSPPLTSEKVEAGADTTSLEKKSLLERMREAVSPLGKMGKTKGAPQDLIPTSVAKTQDNHNSTPMKFESVDNIKTAVSLKVEIPNSNISDLGLMETKKIKKKKSFRKKKNTVDQNSSAMESATESLKDSTRKKKSKNSKYLIDSPLAEPHQAILDNQILSSHAASPEEMRIAIEAQNFKNKVFQNDLDQITSDIYSGKRSGSHYDLRKPVKSSVSHSDMLKMTETINDINETVNSTGLETESRRASRMTRSKINSMSRNILPDNLDNSILCINVNRTDYLISSASVIHPLVQIHVLDISSGEYLLKSSPDRLVTSSREPQHVNYILPMITKTFKLFENETKSPVWNQNIILNEKYLHIVNSSVIIFFEIMDFVIGKKSRKKYPDGWNRVAWAFLKPIGSNGKPTTEAEARLQLYKYPPNKPLLPYNPQVPLVYRCYKEPWKKYSSTLYVKISGTPFQLPKTVLSRPMVPTEIELGKIPIEQLLGKMQNLNAKEDTRRSLLNLALIKPKWRRKPGEVCKLPNKLLYRIDGGERGSFSCNFSNNGFFLAIAGVNYNSYPIKIYQIDTGERVAKLQGHLDLVYQLTWSSDDSALISASSDGSARFWSFEASGVVRQSAILLHPTFVYTAIFHPTLDSPRIIATGAYDGCIRLWKIDSNEMEEKISTPFLKLDGHHTNVNTICFNLEGNRMYSGDGSGIIKIWSSDTVEKVESTELTYECIKTVDTLKGSPIQALRLHPSNRKMIAQTLGPTLHMLDTRIHRILTHFQLPKGKRYEIDNILPQPHILTSFTEVGKHQLNSIHQISSVRFLKSAFSACGTFIFVGSANGTVHFWRSESGVYLGAYCHSALSSWTEGNFPIVDISFHPLDHCIAFAIWGLKEPVRVYTHDSKSHPLRMNPEEESEQVVQKVKHLNVDKIVNISMSNLFDSAISPKNTWKRNSSDDIERIPLLKKSIS